MKIHVNLKAGWTQENVNDILSIVKFENINKTRLEKYGVLTGDVLDDQINILWNHSAVEVISPDSENIEKQRQVDRVD